MSSETVFFILRALAGLALLGFLLTLYVLIWRRFKQTQRQLESARAAYGHLTALTDIDGRFMPDDSRFALSPLTTLGRSVSNSIVVDDSFASDRHARIVLQDGQWWLEDCNSRNGTRLNGETIGQRAILAGGDVIGIGGRHYKLELVK